MMKSLRTREKWVIPGLMVLIAGCTPMTAGPPSGDGGGGTDMTSNGGGTGGGATTGRRIAAIGFETSSGFPQGDSELTFEHEGLVIGFTGGTAMTLGRPPLYAEGSRSWMIFAESGSARVDLSGQDVIAAKFYFVHPSGGSGAQVTWSGSRMLSDPVASVASTSLGFAGGFVDLVAPDGVIIEALNFSFPAGSPMTAQAAIDALVLTVLE